MYSIIFLFWCFIFPNLFYNSLKSFNSVIFTYLYINPCFDNDLFIYLWDRIELLDLIPLWFLFNDEFITEAFYTLCLNTDLNFIEPFIEFD